MGGLRLGWERGVDGKLLPLRERRTDPYGLLGSADAAADADADDDGESAAADAEAAGTTMMLVIFARCPVFLLGPFGGGRADSIRFDSI